MIARSPEFETRDSQILFFQSRMFLEDTFDLEPLIQPTFNK
jgi:hypothetical protein